MRLLRPSTELTRFARSRMSRAALVVAALIPLLYGALYLWAFWNPTGHIDRLDVALVNLDSGARDSDGKKVDAGKTIAEELVSDGKVGWVPTTATAAGAGLASGRYYAVLTIPEDFSAAVVTAGTDRPVKAPLQVRYDDANGVTARTIVASVIREVDRAVSESISQDMVSHLLIGVGDLRDGLAKASDGASELADGAETAHDGSDKLADGSSTLASGLMTATGGAEKLASGGRQLASGAASLAEGLPAAQEGAAALATGAKDLASGSDLLATQLGQAAEKTATLPADAQKLAAGAAKVAAGSKELSESLSSSTGATASATRKVRAALAAELPADSPALAAFDTYTEQLAGSLGAVSGSVDTLAAGAAKVSEGAASLNSSAPALASGLASAADGAVKVSDGASDLSDGASTLAAKLGAAVTGAKSLASGSSTLAGRTGELAGGLTRLSTGAGELRDGVVSLDDGLSELASGSGTLAGKLSEAVADVPDFSQGEREANAEVMSSPVSLDASYVHEAAGVGEGMAPYFLGLSLYVGGLMMWMLLRPVSQRLLASPVPASRVVAQNLTPAILLGSVQAMLLVGTLLFGLGLHVNHVAAFVGLLLLVSAVFVSLQQALNIWFGTTVGRLLTLVLLMLQLTSAGGTYPTVTSDPFFQALHQVLPMTQVVTGLRQAITGDLGPSFWAAVASLAAVLVGSVLASAWGAARARTWTVARLHPAVSL